MIIADFYMSITENSFVLQSGGVLKWFILGFKYMKYTAESNKGDTMWI